MAAKKDPEKEVKKKGVSHRQQIQPGRRTRKSTLAIAAQRVAARGQQPRENPGIAHRAQ